MNDGRRPPAKQGEARDYFYANLYSITDDCKLWPYGRMRRGYGVITIDRHQYPVHQLACQAWNGPKPPGMQAAHGPCNRPSCFNGAHLSWKTPKENMADQVRDGTAMLGAKNHATKLTPEIVMEIRRRYALGGVRQVDLATEFGIKQPALSSLIRRETWWHVP